jgi:hypothetical protein
MTSRPILVTGAHRTGTTWVGKTLALARGVGYIHEPFNHLTDPGISTVARLDGYTSVSTTAAGETEKQLSRTLRFSYDMAAQLRTIRNPKDLIRSGRDAVRFGTNRMRSRRPLMKDPLALLSAEWLAETFDMDVIVLIRHPGAFAASLRRLGWTFDFGSLLSQPELMQGHLSGFADEIHQEVERPSSILQQAALLWAILYTVVARYRERHADWIFVRYEDLAMDPQGEYRNLFEHVGEDYSSRIQRVVTRRSTALPGFFPERDPVHSIRRESRAKIEAWKAELSPDEVREITRRVGGICERFYDE